MTKHLLRLTLTCCVMYILLFALIYNIATDNDKAVLISKHAKLLGLHMIEYKSCSIETFFISWDLDSTLQRLEERARTESCDVRLWIGKEEIRFRNILN